jgi:hypothetical protein
MNTVLSWRRHRLFVGFSLVIASVLLITLLVLISFGSASASDSRTPYITHLHSPRGLLINTDGHLVIAEQGTGTDDGRLLEARDLNGDGDADDKGELKKIARHLPSLVSGNPEDPNLAGVSGVTQASDGTYWLVVGGGAATGGGPLPPFSTLGRIVDGTYEEVADLGQYEADHNPDEDEINSNPYDLTFGADRYIYVSDAGANAVLRVHPKTGDIKHLFRLAQRSQPAL